MYFYRFYLSLPVSARNGVAGGRCPSSSSLPRRVVGWSDGQRRNHGPRTQKWPFKLFSKGRPMEPMARFTIFKRATSHAALFRLMLDSLLVAWPMAVHRDLFSLSAKTRILQLRSLQLNHRTTVCKVGDPQTLRACIPRACTSLVCASQV